MLGIQNILRFSEALGKSGSLIHKVGEDKKVNAKDLKHLREAYHAVKAYVGIDYKAAFAEAKEIDSVEADTLAKSFADNLNVGGGTTEEAIEQGFAILIQALEFFSVFFPKLGGPK